jgi:hypothetical protein
MKELAAEKMWNLTVLGSTQVCVNNFQFSSNLLQNTHLLSYESKAWTIAHQSCSFSQEMFQALLKVLFLVQEWLTSIRKSSRRPAQQCKQANILMTESFALQCSIPLSILFHAWMRAAQSGAKQQFMSQVLLDSVDLPHCQCLEEDLQIYMCFVNSG